MKDIDYVRNLAKTANEQQQEYEVYFWLGKSLNRLVLTPTQWCYYFIIENNGKSVHYPNPVVADLMEVLQEFDKQTWRLDNHGR